MADVYACGITMDRPEGDLYEILGVQRGIMYPALQDHVQALKAAGTFTPDQRYAWKALSDSDYRLVYDHYETTKALYDAGFFDDGLDKLAFDYQSYSIGNLTTPVEKLRKRWQALRPNKPDEHYVVLVTTGGMAPIHNGHIAMMEAARAQLEAQGSVVLAGYFAPGHDSYVGQKYGGSAAIPAVHRCAMVDIATRDSDWLSCDPWAARYMPAEINFTDVVHRLENYIQGNCEIRCEVIYVYGDDNAGFGKAFMGRASVMVPRSAISSKMAREGNHDHLNPEVRDYLLTWDKPDTGNLPYLIRNEEDEAIQFWSHRHPIEDLQRRRIQLQSAVRLGIAQLFKSLGHDHKVHLLPVSDQRREARKVIGDRAALSLDPFFHAEQRMDSTRIFELAGEQARPLYRGPRHGFTTLEQQAAMVKPGDYVLVEDDTVTGGTIASTIAILPEGVNIVDQVILSDFADYAGIEYYDVVDLRDFIVGSQFGGLSVNLPLGNSARAPYALPYVSLRARAKIPAEAEVEISRIIWQANVRFFQGTGIKIDDADGGFRQLAFAEGWDPVDLMEDFCMAHITRLLENV